MKRHSETPSACSRLRDENSCQFQRKQLLRVRLLRVRLLRVRLLANALTSSCSVSPSGSTPVMVRSDMLGPRVGSQYGSFSAAARTWRLACLSMGRLVIRLSAVLLVMGPSMVTCCSWRIAGAPETRTAILSAEPSRHSNMSRRWMLFAGMSLNSLNMAPFFGLVRRWSMRRPSALGNNDHVFLGTSHSGPHARVFTALAAYLETHCDTNRSLQASLRELRAARCTTCSSRTSEGRA
jgi:hypothetical protein